MKDGFTSTEIEEFFKATPVEFLEKQSKSIDNRFSNDPRFTNIIKLRNLRVPEVALRHKMRTDTEANFTTQEIDDFFAI